MAGDAVWSAEGTTPDEIEAALRELLIEVHAKNEDVVPARVLNMIVFVDRAWTGEIANRLRGVGRYHASRMLVFAYEPKRASLDARVTIAIRLRPPCPARLALLRETVVVETRRPPPRRPAHDRRPARGHRPADAAVVAARPPRGRSRSCWRSRRRCCSTRSRRPTPQEALQRAGALSDARLRRRPRMAAQHTLARARRGAASTRPRAANELRTITRGHRPPPPRIDGRRAAARRLARLAP